MSSPRSSCAVARASRSLPARSRRLVLLAAAAAPLALSALLVAPAALSASIGQAQGPAVGEPRGALPVTLAEVASQIAPGSTRLANITELLRRDVEAELAAIDWTKESLRRRYKLSAAVVRLETAPAGGLLQVSCTVSAAVRDDRGVILAIVEGRARAEAAVAGVVVAEQGVLAGAVRGAITAVPEAIRRSK